MKIHCNVCNKYRKSKKTKIVCIKKTLSLSIVYKKCGHEYGKVFKAEISTENTWINY